jgi:hypothetical protein
MPRIIGSSRIAVSGRVAPTRYLIPNGDFESIPSFTAATTASNWIDGTAAGSASNGNYKWFLLRNVTAVSAQFDTSNFHSGTASLKLSTTDTTGRLLVKLTQGTIYRNHLVPVLPSTTYVISAWIKTNNAASGSVNGTWIRYAQDLSTIGSNFTLFGTNNGTQTWTYQETSITTGATDKYMDLRLNNNTAGNISDAWFDEIHIRAANNGRVVV